MEFVCYCLSMEIYTTFFVTKILCRIFDNRSFVHDLNYLKLILPKTLLHFQSKHNYVRFEVFTAVTMKYGVFWDVTTCGSCKNRRFGGT
jgi:hypothetical protein